ncbi:YcxB family protein [Methyloglobulus sp.]|uniref:YcxB family protein n=1 Tax=Methyloglobulus sp. TaxID=2518622 RepID=UPI003989E910
MLEIEYEFRDEDLNHFNEMRFKKTDEYRNQIKKNRWIVPGIMMLIGAFYYYYYGDLKASSYIFLVAVLWALLSPKIILLNVGRQVLKAYTHKEKKSMFGTYVLTIDPANPNFLHEKSPSGKNKMAWSELVRVDYGKGYVYIYLDLSTALVIPEATLKRGDLPAFAKQVEKMIERFA